MSCRELTKHKQGSFHLLLMCLFSIRYTRRSCLYSFCLVKLFFCGTKKALRISLVSSISNSLLYQTPCFNGDELRLVWLPTSFPGSFPWLEAGREKVPSPAPPPSQGEGPGNEVGLAPLPRRLLVKWALVDQTPESAESLISKVTSSLNSVENSEIIFSQFLSWFLGTPALCNRVQFQCGVSAISRR